MLKHGLAAIGRAVARIGTWSRARRVGKAAVGEDTQTGVPSPTAQAADEGGEGGARPAPAGTPAPAPASAAAAPVSVVAADAADEEPLAELGDPLATPDFLDVASLTDTLTAQDSGHASGDDSVPSVESFDDSFAEDVSELDFISEADPLEATAAPAETKPPAQPADALADVVDTRPTTQASGPDAQVIAPAHDDPDFPAPRKRMLATLRAAAGRLAPRRVWMPASALAVLTVVGALSWMLMQTSHEKARLEADLAAASQALKRAGVPARFAAPGAPPRPEDNATAASAPAPQIASYAPPAPTELDGGRFAASAPKVRAPVQMECDVSDKTGVSATLLTCIEAFNRATAR